MADERYTVETEGMTLSLILWRRFRRPTSGILEAVLSHSANQGLADKGPYLPVGTEVFIPTDVMDEVETDPGDQVVVLWD